MMLALLASSVLFIGSAGATDAPGSLPANVERPPAVQAASESLALEELIVREIIGQSYASLDGVDIGLKAFQSNSDYFRTSFNAARCIAGMNMRYFVLVNAEWRTQGAPIDGIRAILAHELAHVDQLRSGKRIHLIRLAGLLSKTRMARFERAADLRVVALGYGSGLKAYRVWLYDHVPADKLKEKRRNYFSPEEIDAIVSATVQRPELFNYWTRHVAMNLKEIQSAR